MLQEVHVEVIVALHRLLDPQLKDVGEITGGVQAQINHRVSYAEGATKGGGGGGIRQLPQWFQNVNMAINVPVCSKQMRQVGVRGFQIFEP